MDPSDHHRRRRNFDKEENGRANREENNRRINIGNQLRGSENDRNERIRNTEPRWTLVDNDNDDNLSRRWNRLYGYEDSRSNGNMNRNERRQSNGWSRSNRNNRDMATGFRYIQYPNGPSTYQFPTAPYVDTYTGAKCPDLFIQPMNPLYFGTEEPAKPDDYVQMDSRNENIRVWLDPLYNKDTTKKELVLISAYIQIDEQLFDGITENIDYYETLERDGYLVEMIKNKVMKEVGEKFRGFAFETDNRLETEIKAFCARVRGRKRDRKEYEKYLETVQNEEGHEVKWNLFGEEKKYKTEDTFKTNRRGSSKRNDEDGRKQRRKYYTRGDEGDEEELNEVRETDNMIDDMISTGSERRGYDRKQREARREGYSDYRCTQMAENYRRNRENDDSMNIWIYNNRCDNNSDTRKMSTTRTVITFQKGHSKRVMHLDLSADRSLAPIRLTIGFMHPNEQLVACYIKNDQVHEYKTDQEVFNDLRAAASSNATHSLTVYLHTAKELEDMKNGASLAHVVYYNLPRKDTEKDENKAKHDSLMNSIEAMESNLLKHLAVLKKEQVSLINEQNTLINKKMTQIEGAIRTSKACKRAPSEESDDSEMAYRHSARCDNCDKAIVGNRYKCTICVDYDICESCDKMGIHPEHALLRVADNSSKIPNHILNGPGATWPSYMGTGNTTTNKQSSTKKAKMSSNLHMNAIQTLAQQATSLGRAFEDMALGSDPRTGRPMFPVNLFNPIQPFFNPFNPVDSSKSQKTAQPMEQNKTETNKTAVTNEQKIAETMSKLLVAQKAYQEKMKQENEKAEETKKATEEAVKKWNEVPVKTSAPLYELFEAVPPTKTKTESTTVELSRAESDTEDEETDDEQQDDEDDKSDNEGKTTDDEDDDDEEEEEDEEEDYETEDEEEEENEEDEIPDDGEQPEDGKNMQQEVFVQQAVDYVEEAVEAVEEDSYYSGTEETESNKSFVSENGENKEVVEPESAETTNDSIEIVCSELVVSEPPSPLKSSLSSSFDNISSDRDDDLDVINDTEIYESLNQAMKSVVFETKEEEAKEGEVRMATAIPLTTEEDGMHTACPPTPEPVRSPIDAIPTTSSNSSIISKMEKYCNEDPQFVSVALTLVQMGFQYSQVMKAIDTCGVNADACIEFLLDNN